MHYYYYCRYKVGRVFHNTATTLPWIIILQESFSSSISATFCFQVTLMGEKSCPESPGKKSIQTYCDFLIFSSSCIIEKSCKIVCFES